MSEEFDYVIVGAGSAGCVLANRLSSDPAVRVALVEAGPRDRKLEIKLPAAFPKLFHTKYDWDLFTTSQPELKARELYWPRGKTLGGSSSLNAQMWVRGARADYDGWGAAAPGWSFDEVMPYFRRSENRVGSNTDDVYGTGGPLYIEELRDPNPLRAAFFEACAEAGFVRLAELNDPGIDGYAPTPVTQHRGRRWSAADGYLRPALKRPNLQLFVETLTRRITVVDGRATGVEIRSAKGGNQTLSARREVLLSAGAVHSPHLLQISGIGDPDGLTAAGIPTVVPIPGVGKGLQDHLSVPVIMFTRDAATLVDAEKPVNLLKFLTQRRGMLTSNVGEGVAFGRSEPGLEHPDLEYVFAPVPFIDHGQADPPGHGITIGVVLLQPESVGTVTARSADPAVAPVIDAGYLTAPNDLKRLVAGVEQSQRLFGTNALRGLVTDKMLPNPDQTNLAEYVRATAETLYHPTGTCRMGSDDAAVVDANLAVHGVAALRVVDASVMPQIIRGHTHAPTVMIAERAADLIRQAN
ncbi:MAG: choline dehydrogenase [Pseudonocardiales bacterium]|nr:choline dehydrogenase [Pseudonocardiales bacterium]